MIQKTTLTFTNFFLLFSILFCAKSTLHAQSITPSILTFDRICAGGSTNPTYKASFTYSGYAAGTTFEVELSDKTGSFTTPTPVVFVGEIDDAPDKKTITFSIPSDIVGSDTYSLRVKSSGGQPASSSFFSSTAKRQFPVYYKIHDKQYTINNFIGDATFCSGGSLVLSIDPDRTSPENDSPLKYPSLSYNWYKDNGPTVLPTLMAGTSGPSFTVTAPGTYYVETNYGTCTSLSYSNRVIVTTSGSGSAVTINSSLGNPFCANGSGTVLTATSGNSYAWKKDGVTINGVSTRTYTTNESGTYSVEVDFGGCKASGSINLSSNGFNASIDVADTVSLNEGETINVTVSTDATSPSYEWYLNNNLIGGATTNTYLVAAVGNYKAKISQASGCIATKEFSFKVTGPAPPTAVIPNIVNLSGSYPYWNIPDAYRTATTKLIIISSNGEIMFDDVGSNYDPQVNSFIKDFKNVNPVYYYVIQADTGEKKGSITVIK
ncbi:gliding motility protein SprC [Flavobacterium sp. LAR06]|uniref:gliding motility protein SprC n=1 Tax=Flavobacterium sp. LAR06 TaxID=3064897 RepID=UPI0035C0DCA2